jgi:HK97 family phage prohead protease
MNKLFGNIEKADDGYRIIASTDDVDRDGEIVKPSAFKNLKKYLATNPVILGFHNYYDFPIGKATGGKIGDKALELNIEFADTDRGREAKYLYDNGFMNSFSVGFIPKEWENDKQGRRVYTDVELLEVSAVPVPANASANIIRQCKDFEFKELKRLVDGEELDAPETDGEGATEDTVKNIRSKYRWIK